MSSPLRSIHRFCVECMGGNARLVSTCGDTACDLWHHRSGHRAMFAEHGPLRSIRLRCLDCTGGELSRKAVLECGVPKCVLHRFRFGKNPSRKRGPMTGPEKAALIQRCIAMREKRKRGAADGRQD